MLGRPRFVARLPRSDATVVVVCDNGDIRTLALPGLAHRTVAKVEVTDVSGDAVTLKILEETSYVQLEGRKQLFIERACVSNSIQGSSGTSA